MQPHITEQMYQFLDLTDLQIGDAIYFCPQLHEQHKLDSQTIGQARCSQCDRNYYFVRVLTTADIEYLKSKQ